MCLLRDGFPLYEEDLNALFPQKDSYSFLFSVRSVLHRIGKEMSLQERQKSVPELLSISMGYNALAFRDAMHTELMMRSGTVGRA